MDDQELNLVKAIHRKEIDRLRAAGHLPLLTPDPTIHYTNLPEAQHDSPYFREWNTYRREVAALIAAGCEGAWILIKDETSFGLFGRWEHAYIAGLEKGLQPPFMIHQVLANEPVARLERYQMSWPLSPSPLAQTG